MPPVFRYTDARKRGMSDRQLYALVEQGVLERIGRGVYRWIDAARDDPDLVEIAYRVPRGTLCLSTALAHHDLTDFIPPALDVAVPRGAHRPRLHAVMALHIFSAETFEVGRGELTLSTGAVVGVYNAERSIVDVIRLRHREGTDVAWEALRRWLGRPDSRPAALLETARHFDRAERPVREALEVLL